MTLFFSVFLVKTDLVCRLYTAATVVVAFILPVKLSDVTLTVVITAKHSRNLICDVR